MADLQMQEITLAVPPDDFDWGEAGPPLGGFDDFYLLDENHLLKFLAPGEGWNEGFAGFTEFHRKNTNTWCGGGLVLFDHHSYSHEQKRENPQLTLWSLRSWNPLTVDPGLRCNYCDNNGLIVENRWYDIVYTD